MALKGYKMGAMKRKLGMGPGDFKPGQMLEKMNAMKLKETINQETSGKLTPQEVAIRGLI